jgi:hypothetical protein
MPAAHRRQHFDVVVGDGAVVPAEPGCPAHLSQEPADLADPELDVDAEQRTSVGSAGLGEQREVERDGVACRGAAVVGARGPARLDVLRQIRQRAG